ncbi:MAG TPA: S8 family serine peptidase [Actinocrinis sp.]|uniref:S8 family peptidase n=1 Tax=Actinocrinis sp. TaxID=1920516 RepID=UPI002DDD820D|nr:S8 family serine peptidase [Actinocrinis sp.]HEV2344843.1 S8 family serine peptidase [Actinocrinis sp.]
MAMVFRGGRGGDGGQGRDVQLSSYDPVVLPQKVLNRHGARILEPARAAMYPGAPIPRSTIYRSAVLQIPDGLLTPGNVERLDTVLARIGYRLAAERVPDLAQQLPGLLRSRPEGLPDVQRRVRLEVAPGSVARPIDAWEALQTLRAAGAADPGLSRIVDQIELEHLLVGHALTGNTSTEGHPDTAAYVEPGSGGRFPVDLIGADAPVRCSAGDLGGRRPVIAVLDTGIGTNAWLDASKDYADDAFVLLDQAMQGLVAMNETGDPEILSSSIDAPVYDSPITRGLNTHSGHGSFIAGIIRQSCPDAMVRSVRVMHDDGVIYENDLQLVLWSLLLQVAIAQADPYDTAAAADFVDVISLSAGYYSEDPQGLADTTALTALLTELTERGVLFVASAGNDSTDRECYPAALSQASASGPLPLALAVGALNPNGSKAFFSNDGHWVDYWATGAAVVSTLPIEFNGSQSAQYSVKAKAAPAAPQRRQTLDPDDFRSGFATWSGTSFAAPFVAAELARGLIAAAAGPDLAGVDVPKVLARAAYTLSRVPDFSVPE